VLEDDLQARIMALLPSYGSAQNPIDATAQAIGEVGYARIVEIVRQSERIDTILLISSMANETRAKKVADEMAELVGTTDKPILLCTYTTASAAAIAALAGAGIPCYTAMPSCARAIHALVDYGAFRERLAARSAPPQIAAPAREAVADALAKAGPVLTEFASKALLADYGVPLPPEALAASEAEAVAAAAKIGGAVALKVQSPDIMHKTEAGAVMLGLSDEAAVREGYRTVLARARAAHPNAKIDGVLVQAMARRGRDIILGISCDPDFGPMLMVGLGGIHVEVLKDVAFAPVPLGTEEAFDLLRQLKGAALLDGVRGEPAADRDAFAQLMVTLSRFAADHADSIAEIDLNPVIVHPAGEGLTVVDALIVKRSNS
jgi:acyl-CoA synthetase (NDP forming)